MTKDPLAATTAVPGPKRTDATAVGVPAAAPISGVEPTVGAAPSVSGLEATVTPPVSGIEETVGAAGRIVEPDHGTLVDVARTHYAFDAEIARGGMGRILRARDRRLGREVAVKELLDANPETRARFEREARITARLQHPAIVNIYEAGVFAGGEPFYAMKLVVGESFDAVIANTKPDARLGLLPTVLAVADALAYAHARKVIHRDLKPHNVLVGEFGETVVIDWGLAKDRSSTDDISTRPERRVVRDTETLDGSVMGTPAYMPPEQAAGDPVDERADVYAIGAILYKALSGASPYRGSTAQDILVAVLREPPLPLAKLAPDTPHDLLTIVDKAMARAPADRYPTARELADDLRKFTTGQLVGSHRYTTWQLVRRWARRHRSVLAVAGVLLGVLAVTAVIGVRQIVAERDVAETEREKANASQLVAERKQAEAIAQRAGAEQLADFLLVQLKERLEPIGKLELLEGIGETVVAYYETVAGGGDVGEDQLRQRADALVMLSDVDADKGKLAAATRSLETVRAIRKRIAAQRPGDLEAAYFVAQAEQRLGRVAYMRQDLARTAEHYDAGRAIMTDLVARAPGELKYQRTLPLFDRLQAELARDRGELDRALQLAEQARAALEPLAASDDKSAIFLFDSYRALASIHKLRGDRKLTEDVLARAVEQTSRLAKRQPVDAYWVTAFAQATGELGRAMVDHGHPADALRWLVESRDATEQLVKLDPQNTLWLADLGTCYSDLGAAYHALAKPTEAMQAFQRTLAIRTQLRERAPDDVRHAFNWSASQERIGMLLFEAGDLAGAARSFDASAAVADALYAKQPDVVEIARSAGVSAEKRGDVALARKDVTGAIAHYRKGLTIASDLAAKHPKSIDFLRDAVGSELKLAGVLGQQDTDGALAVATSAIARARQAAAIPNSDQRDLLALALMYTANAFVESDRPADAIPLAREAVQVGEADASAHPQDPARTMSLIEAESVLARALAPTDKPEARTVLARARERLDKLEREGRATAIAKEMRAALARIDPLVR